MLKILIVDDEQLARQRLISLIEELNPGQQLIEAENGLTALEMVSDQKPDIMLLDIRMPIMDGLEVAQHMTRLASAPAIIFTTAYQDHALQAFDIHAVDYLLKPVRKERLKHALERARLLQRAYIDQLRQQDPSAQPRSHLSATVQGNLKLIPVAEIRYLRAEHKYVVAGWPNGELLLDEPLVSLEQEFQSRFVRIHRNALVAQKYINELILGKNGIHSVKLHGVSTLLPVSRRNLSHLRKRIRTDTSTH
jgi:two-component system, LytTR family, response regulator AlgR